MQQIKCVKCGAEIQGKAHFCPKCGSRVEPVQSKESPASMPVNETLVNEMPANEMSVNETPVNEMPAKPAAATVILSVIFSLLIVILGTVASALFIVRQGTGQVAIESAISRVDFSELNTDFFLGLEDEYETLPELIYDNILPQFKAYMPEKKEAIEAIEDFLEEDFFQQFVADKVNDYVTDVITDSGEGKIEVDEVMDFLRRHQDELEDLTQAGYHITPEDFEEVEDYLTQNNILEDFEFVDVFEENQLVFGIIRIICSILTLGILLGLCILLTVILFIVNGKFRRSMIYLGVSIGLIGVLDCVVGAMFSWIAEIINGIANLGSEFYNALLYLPRIWSFGLGGGLILAGILTAVLPQVLRKKKAAA